MGAETSVNIIVPANDNPYGTVYFEQTVYRVQEPLEGVYSANITVRRRYLSYFILYNASMYTSIQKSLIFHCCFNFFLSFPLPYSSGGHFGRLEITYSTSQIDIVALTLSQNQSLLSYYDSPKLGVPANGLFMTVNITSQTDPVTACAAACLREQACQAFSLSSAVRPPSCTWVTSGADQLTSRSQVFTYVKNSTATAILFSVQAGAGSDYTPVTAQSAFMEDGSGTANLSVLILTDKFPEMDENFSIQILKVKPNPK